MMVPDNKIYSSRQAVPLQRSPIPFPSSDGKIPLPSPSTDTRKLNGKSNNPDYLQTTFYLPKGLHRQLKIIATQLDRDMSSIIEESLSLWIDSQS